MCNKEFVWGWPDTSEFNKSLNQTCLYTDIWHKRTPNPDTNLFFWLPSPPSLRSPQITLLTSPLALLSVRLQSAGMEKKGSLTHGRGEMMRAGGSWCSWSLIVWLVHAGFPSGSKTLRGVRWERRFLTAHLHHVDFWQGRHWDRTESRKTITGWRWSFNKIKRQLSLGGVGTNCGSCTHRVIVHVFTDLKAERKENVRSWPQMAVGANVACRHRTSPHIHNLTHSLIHPYPLLPSSSCRPHSDT